MRPKSRGEAISPKRVKKAYFIAAINENFFSTFVFSQPQESIQATSSVGLIAENDEIVGLKDGLSSFFSNTLDNIPAIIEIIIELITL